MASLRVADYLEGRQKNFDGEHFLARGYFVSTVRLDEEIVRKYIREQKNNELSEQQKFDW